MDIFSIDVGSELDTLCAAQLRGTWQIPAELIRLAIRNGATEIALARNRLGFAVAWTGSTIGIDALGELRSALDAGHRTDDRQRSIAELERQGMEGLLWAAALPGASLRVECTGKGRRWLFERPRRRRPRLQSASGGNDRTGVVIQWRCAGLDRRRALRWLWIAARFAPARVVVEGRPIPQGFEGGLYRLRLDEPVPCRIGLTRRGDEPVLWLLRNGVVSARASIPGYPSFEAAVELGHLVPPTASAADMREAVTPFLGGLVDRAVWMMVEVTDRMHEMAETDRERLVLVLLRAARRRLMAEEISRIPLVRTAGDGRRLTVEQIRDLAVRRGGVVAATDVDIPSEKLQDPQSTLVASSEVRGLLSELIDARFQSPPSRERSIARRLAARVQSIVEDAERRFRGVIARQDVPQGNLTPQETGLLTAVRSAVTPVAVTMCGGGGGVGRSARGIVVPRSNPAVRIGADVLAAHSAWLYPVLLALNTGQEPSDGVRRRWLEAMGVASDEE